MDWRDKMRLADKHIHFMGIGGIGVSALAEMALVAGARVSGCDRAASDLTRKLERKGIRIFIGHDPSHVADADLLVHTSAVPDRHPERLAAGDRQERRGGFLARFMEGTVGLGVAGTHGKTTTTWLLAHLLIQAGLDPSVFIGGLVSDLPEGNYRIGLGPFAAELDESDGSFLLPRLKLAVVTNIESEHLGHYGDDASLFAAFDRFAAGVAADGVLVAGVDNPGAAALYRRHAGRKLSFGFAPEAEARADDIEFGGGISSFRLIFRKRDLGRFSLALPGRHNIENALAALGAALEMGVSADSARRSLPLAKGVARRLERLGGLAGAVLYSDYAHHPTEVAASIEALRQRHTGRILVVFQPHLFSRTRDYADAFGVALAKADAVLLADIYPAREDPIPGVTADLLVRSARRDNPRVAGPFPLSAIASEAERMAPDFEAVVMMGAGNIDEVARKLAEKGGRP